MAPKILFVHQLQTLSPVQKALEKLGYATLRASNGLKLISHLEIERPDLIIMDTRSKWPNSFSLCKALRNGKYKTIPIFFLSNNPTKEESSKSYNCGCTQYFSLPTQLDTLYRKVNEFAGTPRVEDLHL